MSKRRNVAAATSMRAKKATRKAAAAHTSNEVDVEAANSTVAWQATARSTELLEHEMPAEVLAWIFLHVRGPPSSGALKETRLVCKRWREIIDAHLKLEKPREPYTTAYRLGYLSPPGLITLSDTHFLASTVAKVVGSTASAHDGALFKALPSLIDRLVKNKHLTKVEGEQVTHTLALSQLRIMCGVWDGLTVEVLRAGMAYIHPLDLTRARDLGVKFLARHLCTLLGRYAESEAWFVGWSDADLAAAANYENVNSEDIREIFKALPWLLRRGVLLESHLSQWMVNALYIVDTRDRAAQQLTQNEGRDVVFMLSEFITARGWQKALGKGALFSASHRDKDVLVAVARASSAEVQRSLWASRENRFAFLAELLKASAFYREPVREKLDALHALRFYKDATSYDSDALVGELLFFTPIHCTTQESFDSWKIAQKEALQWLITHLPCPQDTGIMKRLARSLSTSWRDEMIELFSRESCHLPWDPVKLFGGASPYSDDDDYDMPGMEDKAKAFVYFLLDKGYCLPSTIDEYRDKVRENDCRVWLTLFTRLEHAPAQRRCCVTSSFASQAAAYEVGRELLALLKRLDGVFFEDKEEPTAPEEQREE